MKKTIICTMLLAGLIGLTVIATAATGGRASRANSRNSPPGSFLGPNYYIPRVLDGQVITVECSDGYKLSGDSIKKGRRLQRIMPGIIFLHQAGKEKRVWYPLTVQMAGRGYPVLSLDLRGFGENPKLNGDKNKTFDKLPPADRGKMVDDIRNAVAYLSMQAGVDPDTIGLIGAGLGANLALIAAAEPWAGNVKCVVAISPTLDESGFKTEEAARKTGKKLICLAASRGDAASYDAIIKLNSILAGPKELFEGEGSNTGMTMMGATRTGTGSGTQPLVLFSCIPQWLYTGLHSGNPALPPARKRTGR